MAKGDKHRERELAFQILYSLSFAPASDIQELEKSYRLSPHNPHGESGPAGFAWELVRGVWEHEKKLDQNVEKFSHNWKPDRIGRIELILIRLALFELFYMATPSKVVISESLELAGQFGVENATSFINGILDSAARLRPEIVASNPDLKKKKP